MKHREYLIQYATDARLHFQATVCVDREIIARYTFPTLEAALTDAVNWRKNNDGGRIGLEVASGLAFELREWDGDGTSIVPDWSATPKACEVLRNVLPYLELAQTGLRERVLATIAAMEG